MNKTQVMISGERQKVRQKAVYMMTLPGLINCGRAGRLGLVPGMLTHLQGGQVN